MNSTVKYGSPILLGAGAGYATQYLVPDSAGLSGTVQTALNMVVGGGIGGAVGTMTGLPFWPGFILGALSGAVGGYIQISTT